MHTISVKLTNKSNADFYGVKQNETIILPMEEYLVGVVAAEIGNASTEACKAQAVAARTFAYPFYTKDKIISDSSSSAQAFNAQRLSVAATQYPNAAHAVELTQGEILTYNGSVITTCSYCDSNGGRTVSARERWGSERAWLIAKDDPWDKAVGKKKNGHGVGMSQSGAKYAASIGKDYKTILAFYYAGTTIRKEMDSVAGNVKASYLIDRFQFMLDKKWKYVANSHVAGAVDCSGAFYYWYKAAGSYMYHGSNTMYRKYSKKKGKIGTIELKPGMAVYKHRTDGKEPAQFRNDGIGNMYHVGLYIGGGWVIEARGTNSGIVKSKVNEWHYASELVNTVYDVAEKAAPPVETAKPSAPVVESPAPLAANQGRVNVDQLNMRKAANTKAARIAYLNTGDIVTILKENCGVAGWYYVKANAKCGYVMAKYITL